MSQNKFEWTDEKVLAFIRFTQRPERDFRGYYSDLEDFKNSAEKTPLFVTEDGVKLFDRTTEVWGINRITFKRVTGNGNGIGVWINGWYTTSDCPNPKENDPEVIRLIREKFLIFSTEEAANNWIAWNKPCLSVAQVMAVSSLVPLGNPTFRDYPKDISYSFPLPKLLELSKTLINGPE